MKVLLLTSEMNNIFTPTGGAFNLPRLRSLAKIGTEVKIINPVALNAPIKSLLNNLSLRSSLSFFKKIKEITKCKRIDAFKACYKPWVHLPKKQFWYSEVDILHLVLGKTIMDTIEEFRPDIILASWLHPFGTYAKYTKKKSRVPVVAISEGSDLLVFPKKYGGIERIYLDYVKSVDHLVYVSEAQKRDSYPYFPFNRSTVIYNGYDEELFQLEKPASKRKNERIQIISVGGLSYSKGQDILLRAMMKLNERFHLLLVGDGPDRRKYETIIRDESLQERVKIIGEVQHSEVKDLLLESDVYCQPSRSESFGIAALEAMASGLPVVASAVGGLPELISEGFNGFLVQPESVADLAIKIEMAADNSWNNGEIANVTKQNWGWKKWAACIAKVFDEVLTRYQ